MRATPYNAKKKGVCFLKEYDIDPDLGRWNPNWEKNFTGSIKLVQAGAPKLRVPAEKLDPRYKKKPNAKHFGVWHNLSKIRPSHALRMTGDPSWTTLFPGYIFRYLWHLRVLYQAKIERPIGPLYMNIIA